jgi:hypothetical protein
MQRRQQSSPLRAVFGGLGTAELVSGRRGVQSGLRGWGEWEPGKLVFRVPCWLDSACSFVRMGLSAEQ